MTERSTRRLRLLPATAESVRAETGDLQRLAQIVGAHVPPEWPPAILRDALPVFLAWHEAHPEWTGWLGWYAVRVDRSASVLCGSVGFKGPPDASGMVEIGYSVLPDHQGAGLATEMVASLVEWAFSHAEVACVEAETTLENPASIRVLERNGFQMVEQGAEPGAVRYRLRVGKGRPTERYS